MQFRNAIGGIGASGDTSFRCATVDILWSIAADLSYTPYAVCSLDFMALS